MHNDRRDYCRRRKGEVCTATKNLLIEILHIQNTKIYRTVVQGLSGTNRIVENVEFV